MTVRIAAAAYRPAWWSAAGGGPWAGLETKVADAAAKGAQLLVFPEYAGCEMALDLDGPRPASAAGWAQEMAQREREWRDGHLRLAQAHGVWIVAGSICAQERDSIVNRAYLCGPNGELGWQDKLILTPYERDEMQIDAGFGLKVFDTPLAKIGVLICYDSEFPLLARQLVEAGAEVLIVPSATDYRTGHTRVRQSCRARAIEGQCLVVQAPVLGGLADCDVLDCGTGQAGFFVPPDYGLPEDGILAQGDLDQEGWVFCTADLAKITGSRSSGQVGNVVHWPEQSGHQAEVTALKS